MYDRYAGAYGIQRGLRRQLDVLNMGAGAINDDYLVGAVLSDQ